MPETDIPCADSCSLSESILSPLNRKPITMSNPLTNALILTPIHEVGGSRTGSVTRISYDSIVTLLGPPNSTDLDDDSKVQASWGMKDQRGRKLFLWAYKCDPQTCHDFSADGSHALLSEVFGDRFKSGWQ